MSNLEKLIDSKFENPKLTEDDVRRRELVNEAYQNAKQTCAEIWKRKRGWGGEQAETDCVILNFGMLLASLDKKMPIPGWTKKLL
jgi:hypothetical protein